MILTSITHQFDSMLYKQYINYKHYILANHDTIVDNNSWVLEHILHKNQF